jgi:hypothetical protein
VGVEPHEHGRRQPAEPALTHQFAEQPARGPVLRDALDDCLADGAAAVELTAALRPLAGRGSVDAFGVLDLRVEPIDVPEVVEGVPDLFDRCADGSSH